MGGKAIGGSLRELSRFAKPQRPFRSSRCFLFRQSLQFAHVSVAPRNAGHPGDGRSVACSCGGSFACRRKPSHVLHLLRGGFAKLGGLLGKFWQLFSGSISRFKFCTKRRRK